MSKYGFVYIWRDRKHNRYYIGCHWGREDDGYVCSSPWMLQAYRIRPQDFKRRILKSGFTDKSAMYDEETRWLSMIKPEEIKPTSPKPRYYNLYVTKHKPWHVYPEGIKTVGQKISAAKKGRPSKKPPDIGQKISAAKQARSAERRKVLESEPSAHVQAWRDHLRAERRSSGNAARSRSLRAAHARGDFNGVGEKISSALTGRVGWRKGIPLTEEHRAKISASRSGGKHWNRGKRWITDGSRNRLVPEGEVPEGWRLGKSHRINISAQ